MPERLVVAHRYTTWLRGTLTWLHNQIRLLPADIENHVIVESRVYPEQFPIDNLHVLDDEPGWRRFPDRVLRRMRVRDELEFVTRTARGCGARILHSHFGEVGWSDARAAERASCRHVVTFYGADVNATPVRDGRWYARYRDLFARVDRVLCEGPHMATCIERLGCDPAKMRVHPLGIEIERFPYRARRWVGGEPFRVLIAGVFREKKGFPDALTALGLLARARPDLRLEVDVIGDAASEHASVVEKERIHAIAARFGLRVKFRGFVPYGELIAAYYENHVFLSPSLTAPDGDTEGGMPVSILEACASGMPVVSTTHCDIPNLVPDGAVTRLVPERSPDALCDALCALLDHPDGWAALGQRASEHVSSRHSASVRAAALAEIYREIA